MGQLLSPAVLSETPIPIGSLTSPAMLCEKDGYHVDVYGSAKLALVKASTDGIVDQSGSARVKGHYLDINGGGSRLAVVKFRVTGNQPSRVPGGFVVITLSTFFFVHTQST